MRKYHNNLFYNTALPIALVIAIFGCIMAFLVTTQMFFVFVTVVLCVIFKSIHHGLENLSLQQRKDFGLINKKGEYYPLSLSNLSEQELESIRSETS